MVVEKQAYREAMARLGAAVHVITTGGPGGSAGFTASAVCSVTDAPPTLLVCANRANDSYAAFRANGVLSVSTLGHSQQDIANVFAGLSSYADAERFSAGSWSEGATGAPSLDDASVAFDCRISQILEVGTHDIFICSVEAVRLGPLNEGLIYYQRGYHRIALPQPT